MPELKTKTAWTCLGDGIYRNTSNNRLYERIKVNGSRTWRALETTNLADARKVRTVRQSGRVLAKAGIQRSPDMPPLCLTFGEVLDLWESAGCPEADQVARTGVPLDRASMPLTRLREWWKNRPVEGLRPMTVDQYIAWRRESGLKAGAIIKKELVALSQSLDCAARRERVKVNPFRGWPPFVVYDASKARHCRDTMPANGDVLHQLARAMFSSRTKRRCITGWQMLFEAFTGLRTGEAVVLRLDAKPGEPGFIDGNTLHVRRLNGGVNPYVQIHPVLRQLLDAFLPWHEKYFPESKWWFPSFDLERHADRNALNKALRLLCSKLGLPKTTSHGMRAFYVYVRRSALIQDVVIAAEIGDSSGAQIITDIYGGLPPNWTQSEVGKITWLPGTGEPAWSALKP